MLGFHLLIVLDYVLVTWYPVWGSNPSDYLERVVTSPEVERDVVNQHSKKGGECFDAFN